MWQNYWTAAIRALAKNRTYSIINIAGLAIGMAACILILLYVRYEQATTNGCRTPSAFQVQSWCAIQGQPVHL